MNTAFPLQVTDAEFALGSADLERLLPSLEDMPAELLEPGNPWRQLSERVLDSGISTDHQFIHSDGIDTREALRHIGAVMQSAGDDQRKIGGVAYLMSRWFQYARVCDVTAAAA